MVDGKNWRKLCTIIFPYTYTGVAIHPDTFTLADSTQILSDLNLVCLSYSIRNPAARARIFKRLWGPELEFLKRLWGLGTEEE
jgi:hypothetical protein